MRRFILGLLAAVGAVVVALVIAAVGVYFWVRPSEVRIADGTVLSLDIGSGFPDRGPTNPLERLLFPGRPPLRDVLDALERASDDQRVKGLFARVGPGEVPLAQAQELRDAVKAFRAKGKRAVVFADSFGEFSSGTRNYYLATAFDDIWLQPLGLLGLVGLRVEEPFFRGTLDMLGLEPRFDHREQYKSAVDPLTEKTMTAPDHEQIEALLDSLLGQIVSGIAADRRLDEGTVRALVDRGPLLAHEALGAHLVDHLGYADEALASLQPGGGAGARPMTLAHYLDAAGRPHRSGPTIALIYATGMIERGSGSSNPLSDDSSLAAQRVIRAFRMAERDSKVRAILFRIDSPGGSAVASESIWRETMRAKKAGKKVIVSMGGVAGSGGYYIAAGADKIVADPATLTGSIGVVAGKVLVNGLLDKIGAGWSAVQVGGGVDLFSPVEDFTPEGHRRFEAFLDDVYDGFKNRVAEGRKLDAAAVEAVAKGRIWSGADAKSHGLVDALGGYATALRVAKEEAGIPATSNVTVSVYPPPKEPVEELVDRLLGRGEEDEDDSGASALSPPLEALRQALLRIEALAMPPGAVVMTPPDLR